MSPTWSQESFAHYVAMLSRRYGEAAVDVRHELFFLTAGRSPATIGARACVALLRDAWLLMRGPVARAEALNRPVLLLATLAGESGWGTLARSMAHLPEGGATVLAHPRLASRIFPADLVLARPMRPSAAGLMNSLHTFFSHWFRHRSLLLASCLARRVLWRDSLSRTLGGRQGLVVLHNDFDLMSRAAIGQGAVTVCLQHGLPTDEFFPTRADWYVVWGPRSRQAFAAAGCPERLLVEDALGRGAVCPMPETPPSGLSLLSQTHAPIFGEGLGAWLRHFADELLALAPRARILLHPRERSPYRGRAGLASHPAPHPELRAGEAPRLVMGCCTTALFDAALAGHWVMRLAAPLQGNQGACHLLALPLQASTAEQAHALYERLCSDAAFRQQVAKAQIQWLHDNFSQVETGLSGLLARLGMSGTRERA